MIKEWTAFHLDDVPCLAGLMERWDNLVLPADTSICGMLTLFRNHFHDHMAPKFAFEDHLDGRFLVFCSSVCFLKIYTVQKWTLETKLYVNHTEIPDIAWMVAVSPDLIPCRLPPSSHLRTIWTVLFWYPLVQSASWRLILYIIKRWRQNYMSTIQKFLILGEWWPLLQIWFCSDCPQVRIWAPFGLPFFVFLLFSLPPEDVCYTKLNAGDKTTWAPYRNSWYWLNGGR
jgi:hypothetical protein